MYMVRMHHPDARDDVGYVCADRTDEKRNVGEKVASLVLHGEGGLDFLNGPEVASRQLSEPS